MLRSHGSTSRNFSISTQLTVVSGVIVAVSLLSACTFGPRDPESAPDNRGDEIAEATAREGERKVDKDGFRTPDAQPVKEDDALPADAAPTPKAPAVDSTTAADSTTANDAQESTAVADPAASAK